MEIFYKIYCSALEEHPEAKGYVHVAPVRCPNFLTEQEAEQWLVDQKLEPIPNNKTEIKRYFFIKKTFVI